MVYRISGNLRLVPLLPLLCLVLSAVSYRSARGQIPVLTPPERISIYAQGISLVGDSDVESDGDWPFGTTGVGVELGYAYQAEQIKFMRVDFELGIGYEYQAGLRSRRAAFDFRGAVQALPSIAIYLAKHADPRDHAGFYPYVGLRTGYVTLLQSTAYDASQAFHKVDGAAYQLGGVIGIQHSSGLFFELSSDSRRFRSLRYDPVSKPSDGLPKELNASQLALTIGFQVFKPKPEPKPGGEKP